MVSDNFAPLPPPSANDTHNNVKSKRVRVTDGRKMKATKGLVQHNVKVVKRTADRFTELFKELQRADPDFTRGDLFEAMLEAFLASKGKAVRSKPAATARVPDAKDAAEGRSAALEAFVSPDLAQALKLRSKRQSWTMGQTIEHACAVAKDAEARASA